MTRDRANFIFKRARYLSELRAMPTEQQIEEIRATLGHCPLVPTPYHLKLAAEKKTRAALEVCAVPQPILKACDVDLLAMVSEKAHAYINQNPAPAALYLLD